MRVNRIIIKNSGILKNIDAPLSQVTLVIGDNERGKTSFLNWIAKGLFENPDQQKDNSWSTNIHSSYNVKIDTESFIPHYDGRRMENLLYVKETDLLWKYKNQEELFKHEYWNHEINSLLYGSDDISPILQKSFLRAMGVGKNVKDSWLVNLHNTLFNIKNCIEDLIPELEHIKSNSDSLNQLNQSLGDIHQTEIELHSKEDIYFMLDKVQLGEKYIDAVYKHEEILEESKKLDQFIVNKTTVQENLNIKDEKILKLEDEITDLSQSVTEAQNTYNQAINEPYELCNKSFGELILGACIGILMILAGVTLAFNFMKDGGSYIIRLVSLGFFVTGVCFLISTWIQSHSLQQLFNSSITDPNSTHQSLINKTLKDLRKKEKQLEQKQKNLTSLKEEITTLKKDFKQLSLKIDTHQDSSGDIKKFYCELEELYNHINNIYETTDIEIIREKIIDMRKILEEHSELFNYTELQKLRDTKAEILNQKTIAATNYNESTSHISKAIKIALSEINNIENQEMIQYFYPEAHRLTLEKHDFTNYNELLHDIEILIDKVGNDRYRAEKIAHSFHHMEFASENLVSTTLASPFFEFLVQNIFGGKYRTFIIESIPQYGTKIFAETFQGELLPLETLSAVTYTQFWFILRLSLAKTILRKNTGVILLDDAFQNFDAIRKQGFLDVLNAFVQQGWQIIISITDDKAIINNFTSLFRTVLTVVDLNKDYE